MAKLLQPRKENRIPRTGRKLTSGSDNANFINFCQGKALTNGAQVRKGSCNGIRKYQCGEMAYFCLTPDSHGQHPRHDQDGFQRLC